jgi:acetyltransferase
MNQVHRRPYTHAELTRLVNPQTVAVIGASSRPNAFGQQTLANLKRFRGTVYPINPKAPELQGWRCYTSVSLTPQVPDCAILAVPRESVIALAHECGQRGVGGIIVYASGFAEEGTPQGIALQEQLVEIGLRYRMRVVGPNCVGIVNVGAGAGLHFMAEFERMALRQGRVALVSQSGALGFAMLQAMQRGAGFSYNLAAGNACDVDVADYINFLADDEHTSVVACALEGLRDGERFLAAARRLREQGKQLVVYKSGRGATGGDVALSHTGSLVGSMQAYQSAFEAAGAVEVDDLAELLETANFHGKVRGPARGGGIGVMATSGGAAVIMADKAEEHGVGLPDLAEGTLSRLAAVVPSFGRVGNPCDTTAQVVTNPGHFALCVDAFLQDENVAGLVVPMVYLTDATPDRVRAVSALAQRYEKPIALVWMNGWLGGPGIADCEADPMVASFHSPDICFRTLRSWLALRGRNTKGEAPPPLCEAACQAVAQALAAAQGVLTERESKKVLSAVGVPVTHEALARDSDAAVQAAEAIGYPIALKIESPDIAHKTEAGVVRLNLRGPGALRVACEEVLAAARRHAPDAAIKGLLVQQMVDGGLELMVGSTTDRQFGPLITVGFGGTLVELLADTCTRLAPVSRLQALEMLGALRGARLLDGYRGSPAADRDRLADLIVRVSQLAAQFADQIDQIDVNPVIVSGARVTAVDALIVKRSGCRPSP